ncbi:hypothetical protein D0Z03_002157 [Geotrichum reessii]|nr:hypothetical protein D0Z03_002157 [Galactomyces reessii]
MAITLGGIIKYEDANSPVVTSTLYTLRRSKIAYEELGDNIAFASLFPWISGSLSTAHGNVTFWYNAKGTKNDAVVKFSSIRDPVTKKFNVHEWSIKPAGKPKISLLGEEFRPFIPSKNEEPTSRHKSE